MCPATAKNAQPRRTNNRPIEGLPCPQFGGRASRYALARCLSRGHNQQKQEDPRPRNYPRRPAPRWFTRIDWAVKWVACIAGHGDGGGMWSWSPSTVRKSRFGNNTDFDVQGGDGLDQRRLRRRPAHVCGGRGPAGSYRSGGVRVAARGALARMTWVYTTPPDRTRSLGTDEYVGPWFAQRLDPLVATGGNRRCGRLVPPEIGGVVTPFIGLSPAG